MEDDNELEQATGSSTAGENEFVHIESVDSAQMDGASINQVITLVFMFTYILFSIIN